MSAIPDPPLAQRSWLARGQFSPSPTWGKTGHPIMYETLLTFYRRSHVKDSHGGFKGSGSNVEFSVWGHAELLTENAQLLAGNGSGERGTDILATTLKRFWWIQIDMPVDTDLVPGKGTRVRFLDQLGAQQDISIAQVDVPEGGADHLEIQSESFA